MMRRIPRQRHATTRKTAAKPFFALLSLLLSVVWLWNNAALCIASTSASVVEPSAAATAALACHCLKCPMTGGKCCCVKKAMSKSSICLRSLCDGEDEALARAVWLPPTLPVAALVACPPLVAPVPPAPALPSHRLTARVVAPPIRPPRAFSPVKKIRRFLLS